MQVLVYTRPEQCGNVAQVGVLQVNLSTHREAQVVVSAEVQHRLANTRHVHAVCLSGRDDTLSLPSAGRLNVFQVLTYMERRHKGSTQQNLSKFKKIARSSLAERQNIVKSDYPVSHDKHNTGMTQQC